MLVFILTDTIAVWLAGYATISNPLCPRYQDAGSVTVADGGIRRQLRHADVAHKSYVRALVMINGLQRQLCLLNHTKENPAVHAASIPFVASVILL
ncbi:MAG: hypothetical protein JO170_13580 [Verrucomicrobia bacterium]|nr:hypothetical protein [Verrucomicrobiota bacterium]